MSGSGSSSSLTGNFISFLQSQRAENPIDPVAGRLLTAMQKVPLLPLPDVLAAAGVTEVDAPHLVERLRAQGLIELVEKEGQKERFLRLTPRGFEKASALSTS